MAIEQDILLIPQSDLSADSPDTRPIGLLDQLLEDGSISRQFVMSGTTFQVKTTARFDPNQACFFRCVVLRENGELSEAPWAPIFCNLAEKIALGEDFLETRLVLAREALEVHLSLCHRVERQLEEKGDLVAPNVLVMSNVLQTHVPWPYFATIFTLVAIAGAWYGFERWRLRLPGPPISLRPADRPSSEPSVAAVPAGPLAVEASSDPLATGIDAGPAGDSAPSGSAAIDRTSVIAAAPSRRSPKSRQKPEPERPPRTAKLQPTKPPPAVAPPPAQMTARPRDPPRDPDPPARVDTAVGMPTLITEIVPNNYQLLRLEPGANVYRDASIRISEIPRAYRGLPCVTTGSRQGGTEQGILLQLSRPARVFVAHDARVKKKPKWLASFRATGDTLRALEVDKGRTVDFEIFHRDVPVGAVALGSNTRAKALKRMVREFVPRKNLVMYLVCLAEANGQVPSTSNSRRNR